MVPSRPVTIRIGYGSFPRPQSRRFKQKNEEPRRNLGNPSSFARTGTSLPKAGFVRAQRWAGRSNRTWLHTPDDPTLQLAQPSLGVEESDYTFNVVGARGIGEIGST